MKLFIIKLFIAVLPFMFFADNTNYKVKSSAISFKIKNAGVTVDGFFKGLVADIKFNPLKPEDASITATIDTKTINTGNDMRDTHLSKPEYFDVEKYPTIKLASTKIEKTGPISFLGTFKLTIKDVTKEIPIRFNFIKIPDKTEFTGEFSINRRDYNVGGSSMMMGDNVDITLEVEVTE